MEVIFERNAVNSFKMVIDLFDTVPRIKEKIQKRLGVPISDQTLIFENTVLSDDFNILFSNIIHRSRIQLLVASDHPPAKKIRTTADLPPPPDVAAAPVVSGKNADVVDCEANADQQKVSHEGNGAEAESRVKVARAAAGMRVVVVYEGKRIPVEVGKDERVGEVRKKLEKMKVKLPEEGCFFIHKQDLMEDDQTFRWHKVNQGDEIDMFVGRVTGGS